MANVDADRKLVAVLCADVVGYSRMIGEDEEGTLAALAAHMSELIEPTVADHHGRIVKTTGDGILAEFASPIAAARCSFEIQDGFRARNADVAEPKRQWLRMGLHLGDVMIRAGDIFGDAVNVAARLQSLAEPGSVYSSAAVVDQLRGHVGFAWEDLGEKSLKNISRPVKVFRLAPASPATTPRPSLAKSWQPGFLHPRFLHVAGAAALAAIVVVMAYVWLRAPSPATMPSLAVLPFANQSGDPADDYFSDGITGDVINALGRFSGLRVMAYTAVLPYKDKGAAEAGRALGVEYLVDGSVRRAADRVRVSTRLTDAQRGTLVWSEQFEKALKDVFDVQDAIALRVAGTLAARVTRIEQQRALAKRPNNLDAYDLVLRGRAVQTRRSRATNREARQLFERAMQLDANYAAAYALLGHAYRDMATLGWTEFPADMVARAEELARKALAIDPDNLDAHRLLSQVHNDQSQYERALSETDRALALNPSDAVSHAARGETLLWVGRFEEAIAALETGLTLDPNMSAQYVFTLGTAYYISRRHTDAVRFLEREALRRPEEVFIQVVLAAAYGQLGRTAEAQRAAETVRRKLPVFDPQIFGSRFQNREHHEYLTEGLRKAGLM
ncbi:tetratricopeptide repeat protein [Bradyrhizobium sp.]|uniref:tetratricopeptide repeat protein n=1 Tax=Bradyrhizobium sp. TaxID=376 RepID=UPI004037D297